MESKDEQDGYRTLGNKHLLGVFAGVVLLLAIAFTGGYVLGKGSTEKKAAVADAAGDGNGALVPRVVTPDDTASTKTEASKDKDDLPPGDPLPTPIEVGPAKTDATTGIAKRPPMDPKLPLGSDKTPKSGQTFVQVAALTHTEAAATADVLRKQNFKARIAPKPGSATIYRVLVGPTSDASEITATRDALRKIGFRDVIVQRY